MLTDRDHFAMAAFQGLFAAGFAAEYAATRAYVCADAMLAERERTKAKDVEEDDRVLAETAGAWKDLPAEPKRRELTWDAVLRAYQLGRGHGFVRGDAGEELRDLNALRRELGFEDAP